MTDGVITPRRDRARIFLGLLERLIVLGTADVEARSLIDTKIRDGVRVDSTDIDVIAERIYNNCASVYPVEGGDPPHPTYSELPSHVRDEFCTVAEKAINDTAKVGRSSRR